MEAVRRDQVKDFIKNISLLEAAGLVKELEEELGVSAAAPVAVAAAPAAAEAAAVPKGILKKKGAMALNQEYGNHFLLSGDEVSLMNQSKNDT